MPVQQAFNASSEYYDNWVRKAIPGYGDIFAIALRALPFPADATLKVLDLGAGTGLFSSAVFSQYHRAHFVLVDLAEKMLELAQHRLTSLGAAHTSVSYDIRSIDSVGEFDLVISSLAIHHLEHDDKALLFKRIYRALKLNGSFLNIDQVQAPTPELRELYLTTWLEHVRRQAASEEQIQASLQRRAAYDRDALLTDQLDWLRLAGFQTCDVLYKQLFIALFYAQK